MGQISPLSEMFKGVLTFVKSINQESGHHAFVEQFTSVPTKHDHLPGMKDITAVCTGYAIRLLQCQVEVAQKVDYKCSSGDGPLVTVMHKDPKVNTEYSVCTCSFWSTTLLPCRHIISARLHKGLPLVQHTTIHWLWL